MEDKPTYITSHGGRRDGSGRPPKHGRRMVQKTVRLPDDWIASLVQEYGSFQAAVETLVAAHLEK